MMSQYLPNWAIRLNSMCIAHCRRRTVQNLGIGREGWTLTKKVLMERWQKGHLQWMVHSVAYFFWLVKNLMYTTPHGSIPFLAL